MSRKALSIMAFGLILFPTIAMADPTRGVDPNEEKVLRECQTLSDKTTYDQYCSQYNAKPTADSAQMITVPGGTSLRVHLTSELSSNNVMEGDKFWITVIDEVRIGGRLAIPAGARGVGEVVRSEHAESNGREGKLGMRFDYVYAGDGEKVRVSPAINTADGENKKGAASTATIALTLVWWPGLFAHNWVRGAEVYVSPQTPFSVVVDRTVQVVEAPSDVAEKAADVRDRFAHR